MSTHFKHGKMKTKMNSSQEEGMRRLKSKMGYHSGESNKMVTKEMKAKMSSMMSIMQDMKNMMDKM